MFETASELRAARRRAGMSQRALALAAGTSQAAVAAYESGRKQPSVATYERLLAAAGAGLAVRDDPVRDRRVQEVLDLAGALPFRRPGPLRYPRLPAA